MTEPEFIEGPWAVYEVPDDESGIIGDGPLCVVQVTDYSTHQGIETIVDGLYEEERAHLIAAAPELYGMLSAVIEAMDNYDMECLYKVDREEIESLLAKARGEV